jgi:hypothetical protein
VTATEAWRVDCTTDCGRNVAAWRTTSSDSSYSSSEKGPDEREEEDVEEATEDR